MMFTQSGFTGANVGHAIYQSRLQLMEGHTHIPSFRNDRLHGVTVNGGRDVPFSESPNQLYMGLLFGGPIK